MVTVWAGYRYFLFGFLLVNPIFILIISAQNVETGRLVGGGLKSNIYTLIVSIFNAFFLAIAVWFDITESTSIIAEVRWELIWTTTITLFNIIGIASIASNPPAPETCSGGPDSTWNICSSSGVLTALLVLSVVASTIHAFILVVMVIRQSGRTELNVWEFMTRKLPYALETTPSVTTGNLPIAPPQRPSREGMVEIDLNTPKTLSPPPPVPSSARPISLDDSAGPIPPPTAYGRRDPFTFSSVSSLLNPAPRELADDAQRYQLYDRPIPIARPPVQRDFERVSPTSIVVHPVSYSAYYAPTPVYERFARGGATRAEALGSPSMYSRGPQLTPSPPTTPPRVRRQEGDFVPWHATDEHAVLRSARGKESREPVAAPESETSTLPSPTRPPRVLPGSLPNPNTHRPNRI